MRKLASIVAITRSRSINLFWPNNNLSGTIAGTNAGRQNSAKPRIRQRDHSGQAFSEIL